MKRHLVFENVGQKVYIFGFEVFATVTKKNAVFLDVSRLFRVRADVSEEIAE
jgi:hypothetical protein